MARQKIQDCVMRFIHDENGATAIEYGLLAALISVVIGTAAGLVGTELDQTFRGICQSLNGGVAC